MRAVAIEDTTIGDTDGALGVSMQGGAVAVNVLSMEDCNVTNAFMKMDTLGGSWLAVGVAAGALQCSDFRFTGSLVNITNSAFQNMLGANVIFVVDCSLPNEVR